MISVASGGTTERIASRISTRTLRAAAGAAAMYCSTVCGAALPLRAVLLLGDAFLRPAERDVAFFLSAEVFNARVGWRLAGFAFFIPRWYRKRSATGKE